jgi:hypothetical protein
VVDGWFGVIVRCTHLEGGISLVRSTVGSNQKTIKLVYSTSILISTQH